MTFVNEGGRAFRLTEHEAGGTPEAAAAPGGTHPHGCAHGPGVGSGTGVSDASGVGDGVIVGGTCDVLDTGGGDGLGPGVGDTSTSGDGLGEGVCALGDGTGLVVEADGVTTVELRSIVDGAAALLQW